MSLTEADILIGQVGNDVLWRHFNHPSERFFFLRGLIGGRGTLELIEMLAMWNLEATRRTWRVNWHQIRLNLELSD